MIKILTSKASKEMIENREIQKFTKCRTLLYYAFIRFRHNPIYSLYVLKYLVINLNLLFHKRLCNIRKVI
ncbi:hypothetical protein SAMN05421800_101436 [Chryseobacterium balustinum]|uniref:Uncharacterized protein n=1 Tax=Chryseobacterium balustinum TaxID=246 RepID=A0AAX2IGR5_9FLAO|nr:hypothetical protein SAMN05421800_101436 [Chryseobacterium balustinum]SQA87830.1 Uncharacterised protein [Chryseobacterium balustinum]